ncbi:hypothetical protein [Clostridium drakei]|uniref:Uncharacterized protein n=1 Tax=Clostridium drakei TaxID=332101 RepID=A0A2U8DM35_9CLOT|nr:hypothetical protein [Clostridium drakei]AWI03471.1 hypothetical protein B9W14_02865 [Clostridium drakei]
MDNVIIENRTIKKRFRFEGNDFSLARPIMFDCKNVKYMDIHNGTTTNFELNSIKTLIKIDIPLLLPLQDRKRYDISLNRFQTFKVWHRIKRKGEENYSALIKDLPEVFSSLEILAEGIPFEDPGKIEPPGSKFLATLLCEKIIEKILYYINIGKENKLGLEDNLINYELHYFEKQKNIFYNQPDFSIYIFCDGIIKVEGDHYKLEDTYVDRSNLLKEQIGIEQFIINTSQTYTNFRSKLNNAINLFLYYCSQHSRAISKLNEEEIRDLFLVNINSNFGNGEGEAFNFDGKLDFKIKNPENQCEFASGEFKLWTGEKSFDEIYYQGTEKHCSGYESAVYLIIISDRKDILTVNNKIIEKLKSYDKVLYDGSNKLTNIAIEKSKTYFYETAFNGRLDNISLCIGICDIYYEPR